MRRGAPVVVLGGGPAGALAALTLARAGTPCYLLERHAEGADKVCGEFLSPEAIARLDGMGFPWQRAEAVPIRRLRLEAHGHGLAATLPFAGRAVRRTFLDRWLLEQAERAGTRVELGVNVRSVERVGDGFEIDGSDRRRAADLLVLATGKHAAGELHRRRPDGGSALVGWKMSFRALGPGPRRALADCLSLFFFAGGYGGIARTSDDLATVSLLLAPRVLEEHRQSPLALLAALAGGAPTLALVLAEAEPAWGRPLTVANLPYGHCDAGAEPGLFPVGDQFAVLPSFTGTGISFALASGALAAENILRSSSGVAPFAYASQARAMAQFVLRRALPLHHMLQQPAFARLALASARLAPWLIGRVARRTRVPAASELPVSV